MTATPPEEPADPHPRRPRPKAATPSYSAGGPSGATKTNGLAVASLVCGIVGCFWITGIVAIVLDFVARNQIEQSGEQGAGMALAGIILGFVWLGLGIIQFGFLFT
jgi:Domain of unknown function (DUF4190)